MHRKQALPSLMQACVNALQASPGCERQGARVYVIPQQFAIPGPLRLLRLLADLGVGLPVKVMPALKGKVLPEQAWGCVGGHQGGLYQEGPRAAHGVRQHRACKHAPGITGASCVSCVDMCHDVSGTLLLHAGVASSHAPTQRLVRESSYLSEKAATAHSS